MTIDEIKKHQAMLGICIETANKMGLNILAKALSDSMTVSSEYEQLVRKVQRFHGSLDKSVLQESEVW